VTSVAVSDEPLAYLAVDLEHRRHLSLVPYYLGLEALCGSVVTRTKANALKVVVELADCAECCRLAQLGAVARRRELAAWRRRHPFIEI
jgi:hypothetical protein